MRQQLRGPELAPQIQLLGLEFQGSRRHPVGDGSGANAVFNTGSSVTVKIALTDGSTAAPVCSGDTGTTTETNNLKVGACTAASGTPPSVSFTESH